MRRRGPGFVAAQLAAALALLAVWQFAAARGLLDPSFFGTPAGVGRDIVAWLMDGSLPGYAASTLAVLAAGLAGGTVLGALLGVLIGRRDTLAAILDPFVSFFNGMPRLVLQPFFIVWLGFGFAPKVALVIAVIVVVVATNVGTALAEVDGDLVANLRVLGARRWAMVRQVYLPSLTQALIATSRINIGFAFQAALVSEFVGSSTGLGFLIVKGQNGFDVDMIWAALATVVVLSTVLDQAVSLVEVRATRWRPARA